MSDTKHRMQQILKRDRQLTRRNIVAPADSSDPTTDRRAVHATDPFATQPLLHEEPTSSEVPQQVSMAERAPEPFTQTRSHDQRHTWQELLGNKGWILLHIIAVIAGIALGAMIGFLLL